MRIRNLSIGLLILVAVLVSGGYFAVNNTTAGAQIWDILAGSTTDAEQATIRGGQAGAERGTRGQRAGAEGGTNRQQTDVKVDGSETTADQNDAPGESAVAIRPATTVIGEVGAAGNISLAAEHAVAMEVGGVVREVAVEVGDQVQQGDLLWALDSTDLERELSRAQLDLEAAQNELTQLAAEVDSADIALAEAELAAAQENLAAVEAGPSSEELSAARNAVAAAWAHHDELVSGPTDAQMTQMRAELATAEVALKEAQQNYDEVAWRFDVGMTAEAAALEKATIDYEAALAAFDVALETLPSDVQSAISAAQNAQHQLNTLEAMPTEADIATAKANVAEAEANLQKLVNGPDPTDLKAAEIALAQALIDLEEANTTLAKTQVVASMDGTILAVDISEGEYSNAGQVALTIADTTSLELTINVAEVDVRELAAGQQAEITIDALPGMTYQGEVERIAPTSDPTSTIVAYPVIIQLTDQDLTGVLPGMTAVASIQSTVASGGWLVPTTAVQQQEGTSVVTVLEDGGDAEAENDQLVTVPVIPGTVQGEWTVVESTELQNGDRVLGSLASFIDEDDAAAFGPRGRGGNVFRSVTR